MHPDQALEDGLAAEGKSLRLESGEGYFRVEVIQSQPNWRALSIGWGIAALSLLLAFLTRSEAIGFWFFLLFGLVAIVSVTTVFLVSVGRQIASSCEIKKGYLTWKEGYPLPERFDFAEAIDLRLVKEMHHDTEKGEGIGDLTFVVEGRRKEVVMDHSFSGFILIRWADQSR